MIIVNHQVNTLEKLGNTPVDCGVEIDIRPFGKEVILNHEPFSGGVLLEDFLSEYHHQLLILNVKSEGIEQKVLDLVERYGIKDYFFLDVTFPYMVKYINRGIKKFAVRFSEYESIQTCMNLSGKVEWVFVDNFTHLPVENDSFKTLGEKFRICIVSPELLKRDEVSDTKKIIGRYPVDAVLTDHTERWKE